MVSPDLKPTGRRRSSLWSASRSPEIARKNFHYVCGNQISVSPETRRGRVTHLDVIVGRDERGAIVSGTTVARDARIVSHCCGSLQLIIVIYLPFRLVGIYSVLPLAWLVCNTHIYYILYIYILLYLFVHTYIYIYTCNSYLL